MKQLQESEASLIRVEKSLTKNRRVFGYTLNKKKSNKKLLKAANKDSDLQIEVKTGCTNLRFSGGSYHEVMLPL